MDASVKPIEMLSGMYERAVDFSFSFGPKIIGAILVYWIGSIIIKKISHFTGERIEKSGVDSTLAPFFKNMFYSVLKLLLVITVIGIMGVETTSLAAVIAAAGLAVGMALQGSLGNFAGGVLLLVFRPIAVGEVIKAQGYEGKVTEILLFVTVLKTLDNRIIYLPNGPLAGGAIENYSREEWRRVDMTFKINGDQNIDAVKDIILLAVNSVSEVAEEPRAEVVVTGLTEYAIELQARPFCRPENYYDVIVKCQEAVKKTLTKTGVKGPTPNQNIYLQQVSVPNIKPKTAHASIS